MTEINDPLERLIAEALDEGCYRYETNVNGLDFYLLDWDVYIEVKQFHSHRISDQMMRASDIIAVQGREATELLARWIVG